MEWRVPFYLISDLRVECRRQRRPGWQGEASAQKALRAELPRQRHTRAGTHPIASAPTNRNPKKALFFPPFLPLLLMNRPLPQCGG